MNNIPAPSTQKPALVLFDFDGTLLRGDSFGVFLWHSLSFFQLLHGAFLLLFKLPQLLATPPEQRAERAKAMILQVFFAGKSRAVLRELGERCYREKLRDRLRPELLLILRQHKQSGHSIALVSASMDIWLESCCTEEDIVLICTELAYTDGIFQGELATPNCNRQEKARRIRERFDLTQFDRVIAYGNSKNDAAMFALAQEAWWCQRDGRLEKWRA